MSEVHTRRRVRAGVTAVLVVIVLAVPLVACSGPDGVTCSQYVGMSDDEQTNTIDDRVRQHGFDPSGTDSVTPVQVRFAVETFCGISSVTGTVTDDDNAGSLIGTAVDWDRLKG